MADPKRRLPGNVPGEFFVDARCIDCDACRQLAPEVFTASGGYSVVSHQPATPEQWRRASQAIFACPTGSIGVSSRPALSRHAIDDFPLPLADGVYYCGFNSDKSYGGNSYFVRHPEGNWLVDSPRFTHHLVRKFHEAGGLAYIFLTHRDDVADARHYAREFRAQRIIHRLELHAQPGAEIVMDGDNPISVTPHFLVIPTPGHTRGHCCLVYRKQFLFTGDHLDWDRDALQLDASQDYCWYSWPRQVESVARLLNYSFEWVLPGHGQRVKLTAPAMHDELAKLVSRIK